MVDVSDARAANRSLVLRTLVLSGPMPRTQLAAETGLSKATVSRVVDDLLSLGVAREGPRLARGRRGRDPIVVDFRGDGGIVCGVDVGATNTRIVVSDLAGSLTRSAQVPTAADLDSAGLARWLRDQVADVGEPDGQRIRATVVGVPGVVHPVTEEIRLADNLPCIDGPGFSGQLRPLFPGVLRLENDANLAVVGERAFGAARDHVSAVMVTFGTGIGTGVLVNDQPLVGRSGLVGEFAYLQVTQADHVTVRLEDKIGGPALLRRAAELGHAVAAPAEIFDVPGIPALKELRQEALGAIHALFMTVTLAYEPEVIVVGGGIGPALGPWLPEFTGGLANDVPEAPVVVRSELGDFAGALGALARAWQEALVELGLSRPGLESASAAQLGSVPGVLRQAP
jgi:predicted NBD/HSP70 family sugar kinase